MTNAARLWLDILGQPASLRQCSEALFGEGRRRFLRAADRIRRMGEVLVSGMGSSLYAAIPLAYHLESRGIRAPVIESGELLHYPQRARRVVLLISRSGETVEVTRLLPELKAAGSSIIAITSEPESTLAQAAGDVIVVRHRPDLILALQSYTATALAALLLAAAVTGDLNDSWRGQVDELATGLEAVLPAYVEDGVSWREFLEGASTVYVLGRGPSLASVYEAALLFHEAARMPAVPMSAGSFRHGPIEVVNPAFRALIFAPHDATEELNRGLADHLTKLGGRASLITTEAPALFAPVVEIAPVQVAALRAAEVRGVPAGEFHIASQVTTSEEWKE